MSKQPRSLQNRMFVTCFLVSVLPLIVVGLTFAWQSYTVEREALFDLQEARVASVADEVNLLFYTLENRLQTLIEVDEVDYFDADNDLHSTLNRLLLSEQRLLADIALLDGTGQELARVSDAEQILSSDLRNRADSEMFQSIQQTRQPFYRQIEFDATQSEPVLELALPILDTQTGQLHRVLVVTIRFAWVWQLLQDIELYDNESVYLVDDANRLVAHTDPTLVLQDSQFAQLVDTAFQTNLNSESTIVVTRPIQLQNQELVLVMERLISDAFVLFFDTVLLLVGVLTLAIVVASFLAYRAVDRIVSPIQQLISHTQAIQRGDFDKPIEIVADREITVLAESFNQMADQLRHAIQTLEAEVERRTQRLSTAVEISQRMTSSLDLDAILRDVVKHIQEGFYLYQTHIYLFDNDRQELVMTEGYGEIGAMLKAEKHCLSVGTGIVGTVAAQNEHFISNDVTTMANFVPHPLLPDTKSELALPLRKGEEVLGVLDVQSNQLNRFDEDDVALMQSIANQIAVVIDNASQFAKTEVALQEVERLNQQLTRNVWADVMSEETLPSYRYVDGRVVSTPTNRVSYWEERLRELIERPMPMPQFQRTSQNGELSVPLMLRGEMIGIVGIKREGKQAWAKEELDAVDSVANQISLALENSRLSLEQAKTIVKLQEIDRLKSEFLTSMSHELRTPLNAILGFADVLLQGIDGELTEYAQNDVQLIYNSGQHLLTLINDILDISKIEAGMMEIVPEPLDIAELIDEVTAATSSLVKGKNVALKTAMSDGLPQVYADNVRLKQILLNLVSNAIKFTEDGSITINVHPDEDDDRFIYFSVIDTGIGIPEEKHESIFERFKQADMSTTREYGGTGLGLAICKLLAEMHQGVIGVKSEPGQGSEFYFTMPILGTGVLDELDE